MIAENAVFLVIISIYDGIFKGGMIFIIYEASAEIAYPVGESMSLGLILGLTNGSRFVLNFILGMVATDKTSKYFKNT